jgi:hypothetical protein
LTANSFTNAGTVLGGVSALIDDGITNLTADDFTL